MANALTDEQVLARIDELEQEEQRLRVDEAEAGEAERQEEVAADAKRLAEIRVELDRLWDYLRQRRALRNAGFDPEDAQMRDADTVEGFLGLMAVVAIADMFGINGRREELVAVLREGERGARERAGCRRYTFSEAVSDLDRFVLHSEWDDEAAMEAHYASPEFASFQFALQGLLAKPSEMTIYTVEKTTRPLPSGPMDPRDAD